MNDIIKFIKIILVFFVIVSTSLFYIYTIGIPKMLETKSNGSLERWREFYQDSVNSELIILGSSRARRHCNPQVIAEKTKLSSQTIAVSGAQLGILESFYIDYKTNNKKPKLVLINVDFTGLANPLAIPFPHYFLPFAPDSSLIWEFPGFKKYKYLKALGIFDYRKKYTESIFSGHSGNRNDINGFVGSDKVWSGNSDNLSKKFPKGLNFRIDTLSLIILDRLIKQIKLDNAEAVLFFSPEYEAIWAFENNKDEVVQKIQEIASANNVSLYDFSDSSYYVNYKASCFFNTQHLNDIGASLFSADLADSIIRNQNYFIREN